MEVGTCQDRSVSWLPASRSICWVLLVLITCIVLQPVILVWASLKFHISCGNLRLHVRPYSGDGKVSFCPFSWRHSKPVDLIPRVPDSIHMTVMFGVAILSKFADTFYQMNADAEEIIMAATAAAVIKLLSILTNIGTLVFLHRFPAFSVTEYDQVMTALVDWQLLSHLHHSSWASGNVFEWSSLTVLKVALYSHCIDDTAAIVNSA